MIAHLFCFAYNFFANFPFRPPKIFKFQFIELFQICSVRILGPLSEGAVSEADWGSVLQDERHSLRHGLRRATSLKEGGKGLYAI